MTYPNLSTFLRNGKAALAKGPVGLIMAEDNVEIQSTIDHHLRAGFQALVVFAGDEIAPFEELAPNVHWVVHDMTADAALETAVNRVIAAAPGLWMYYCYNSEYLHYPFSEDRTIGEMLAFNTEERRETILTFTIDLYAGDLNLAPNAVSLENAQMDMSGYYALAAGMVSLTTNGSLISLAAYGGDLKSMCHGCAVGLIVSAFFGPAPVWNYDQTTRLIFQNSTHTPVSGTTT